MNDTHPRRVLIVTDTADPTPELLDAIRQQTAQTPTQFRVVVPNPARAEVHLLHPERHDKAAAAEQVLRATLPSSNGPPQATSWAPSPSSTTRWTPSSTSCTPNRSTRSCSRSTSTRSRSVSTRTFSTAWDTSASRSPSSATQPAQVRPRRAASGVGKSASAVRSTRVVQG